MRQIAPDVFHLPLTPRNGVNAYLVGDVLVDTGLRTSAGKIEEALGGRKLQAIALTHAHGDHGGSARKLSERRRGAVGGGGAGRGRWGWCPPAGRPPRRARWWRSRRSTSRG